MLREWLFAPRKNDGAAKKNRKTARLVGFSKSPDALLRAVLLPRWCRCRAIDEHSLKIGQLHSARTHRVRAPEGESGFEQNALLNIADLANSPLIFLLYPQTVFRSPIREPRKTYLRRSLRFFEVTIRSPALCCAPASL